LAVSFWISGTKSSSLASPSIDKVETAAANFAVPLQPTKPLSPVAVKVPSWPGGDGKDTNVLRRWAHNELEYQRMVEENSRIIRRQLVKLTETVAAVVERSRLTGEPVRELTLPGLDGTEVKFEITQTDLHPSGLQGTFTGRVAGRTDSMVTLAFKNGREAFTVLSPADGIFLQADAHDSGDVIVKSINPDIYAAGVCGTP
jgi:hypothetical protein